eukprot:6470317-Amphidinium_carterae.2
MPRIPCRYFFRFPTAMAAGEVKSKEEILRAATSKKAAKPTTVKPKPGDDGGGYDDDPDNFEKEAAYIRTLGWTSARRMGRVLSPKRSEGPGSPGKPSNPDKPGKADSPRPSDRGSHKKKKRRKKKNSEFTKRSPTPPSSDSEGQLARHIRTTH